MSQQFPIEQYLNMAWRRKWFVVVPAILGLGLARLALLKLPRIYVATATVLEESDNAQLGISRGKGSFEQTKVLTARLLMDDYTLPVARKVLDLKPDEKPDDWTLERVRHVLSLEFLGSVTYFKATGQRPDFLAKVANAYAEEFVERNRENKVNRTAESAGFFDKQLESKAAALNEAQKKLAEFKDAHQGSLPEDSDRLALRNQTLRYELTAARTDLSSQKDARDNFIGLLANIPDAGPIDNAATAATTTSNDPASQLREMEKDLAVLRSKFTDKHPDVQAKIREIETLKLRLAAAPEPPVESPSPEHPSTTAAQLDPSRIGLQRYNQLQSMNSDIRRAERRIANLESEVSLNEGKISGANQNSVAYNDLSRHARDLVDEYNSLQNQAEKAHQTQDFTSEVSGDIFKLQDRAEIPETPISPNPPLVLLAGLGGGIALGVGLILLLEVLDQTYKSPEEITRELGVTVVATITRMDEVRNMARKDIYKRKAG